MLQPLLWYFSIQKQRGERDLVRINGFDYLIMVLILLIEIVTIYIDIIKI